MAQVSPQQSQPGEDINASNVNNPVNQLAEVINGGLDDTNISGISGSKIAAGTLPASASTPDANINTRFDEALSDFVASGCTWSQVSGLNGSMTAGVVYVSGKRLEVSAIASQAFTASRDTYVSVRDTGLVEYSEVANGAPAPSLPANSLWLAIVITDASAITGVDNISITSPTSGIVVRRRLGAPRDAITLENIPIRAYLKVIIKCIATAGTIDLSMTFNNDTGNNYATRVVANGSGASATSANAIGVDVGTVASGQTSLSTLEIVNNSTQEKLVHGLSSSIGTAGANNAPNQLVNTGKWTGSSQINRIDVNNNGTGDIAIGSEVVVLGHD